MNRRGKKDVDLEVDLHGLTAEQLRVALQKQWPDWRGQGRVRIIHGQGEVLRPELLRWCQERGIPCRLEGPHAGASLIFPRERAAPSETPLANTLRDAGLRLTPEQEAYLRDPEAMERARQEERKRREAEERKRQLDEAALRSRLQRDEALWKAEMARLDTMNRQRGGVSPDAKPLPPRILPPSEIKHQEGFWRSELVRVADTDTDTLKKQKRTGLDKLAPPMPERPKDTAPPDAKSQPGKPKAPARDTEADRALFESEMARLMEDGM